MHIHPSFHLRQPLHTFHPPRPWERPAFAAHPVEIGNLVLILLGVLLALSLYRF